MGLLNTIHNTTHPTQEFKRFENIYSEDQKTSLKYIIVVNGDLAKYS